MMALGSSGRRVLLCSVWLGMMAFVAGFQNLPLNFEAEEVAGGFTDPTDFAFIPKGQTRRVLVVEKLGNIHLVVDGVKQPVPFLDLTDRANSAQDRGCLGVAVDLDFNSGQRYIYVSYVFEDNASDPTAKKSGRVSRFTVNSAGTRANPASELVMIGTVNNAGCGGGFDITQDIICLDTTHHAGGGIEMAPDRTIYFASGDGAAVGNPGDNGMRCQDVTNNVGKVFRTDRQGRGLPNNPYWNGNPRSNPSRIWALGFRQPYRLKVDEQLPGCVWVADVGRVDYEEAALVCKNQNHEWPCREGYFDHSTLFNDRPECRDMYNNVPPASGRYTGIPTEPVYAWNREEGTAAVGADRMALPSFPATYRGAVFIMDYSFSWLRYFHVDAEGNKIDGPFDFASNMKGPVQIREGSDGCIWYLSLVTGKIFKICFREDRSIPQVSSVSPPNNLVNVEISTNIMVTVSKRVRDASAVNAIKVEVDRTGNNVAGSTTWDETTRKIRFVPNNRLQPNTLYKVTITGLTDFYGTRQANPVIRRFTTGEGFTTYLSDLPTRFSENGHATRPVLKDVVQFGVPISHDGVIHEKGYGVVPYARICVEVPAGCRRLLGEVAVDDFSRNLDGGALIFEIRLDGRPIWNSQDSFGDVLRRRDTSHSHNVLVEGGSEVCLDTINGGWPNLIQNVGSWGSTRYRCGNFDEVAPSVTSYTALPISPRGGVSVDPTIALIFSEPMDSSSLLDAVRLTSEPGGQNVAWLPNLNGALTRLAINPLSDLEFGTMYCVSVSIRARDLVGNALMSRFEECFTTEERPLEGTIIDVMDELTVNQFNTQGRFNKSGFPRTLAPGTQTYEKGVGLKAFAAVTYDVSAQRNNRSCTRFKADVGVDRQRKVRPGVCDFEVTRQNANNKIATVRRAPLQPAAKIDVPVPTNGVLRLRALGGPDGVTGDVCNFANARLECASGPDVYLSDLTPRFEVGKVRYDTNSNDNKMDLVVPFNTYESGFVITPNARVRIQIPRSSCSKLRFNFGIDRSNIGGKMHILAKVPGLPQCFSGTFSAGGGSKSFECDVSGAEFVTLIAGGGFDGISGGDIALVGGIELDCAEDVRKPTCDITGLPDSFTVGDRLNFRGVAKNYKGELLSPSQIEFRIRQIHCQPNCHQHPDGTINNSRVGTYLIPDHGDYFYVSIECRVSDGANGTTVVESSVFPRTAEITVNTNPPGQEVVVDSVSRVAPFSTQVVIGATFSVLARATTTDGSQRFARWEHNASLTRQFPVRNVNGDRTFTAIYN